MSTAYSTGYRPPFPAIGAILRGEEDRLGPLTALVDTGADVTLVPTALLQQIGASEGGFVSIRSHFGELHLAQQYLIGIQIGDIALPGVYIVADDVGDEVILGRDILNKLPLFLDGPEHQTDLLDDATVRRLRDRR